MNIDYDTALIKQIVARGGPHVLDSVVNALVPGAPTNDETREVARMVMETLFDQGDIKCPKCGATVFDAENKCMIDGDCPVAAGG